MATQILFLHSAGAQGPNEGSSDLVAYLGRELGPKYRIASPIMPDPGHPSYKGWKTQLEKQLDMVDDEIILVGHSLGGSVLLKYFSEIPTQSQSGVISLSQR
jgi:predicted alpha/beta hydrolase family esterase